MMQPRWLDMTDRDLGRLARTLTPVIESAVARGFAEARAEPDDGRWLTVDAAARLLGLGPAAVRQMWHRGELPGEMFGRALRIHRHLLIQRMTERAMAGQVAQLGAYEAAIALAAAKPPWLRERRHRR